MSARQPPGLLLRTLAVTFVTSVLLLVVIFVTVTMSAREQVRQTVSESLEASQRMFAAMHNREQHDLRRQAVTVAESPTLKAAMDTYGAESFSAPAVRAQLLNTIKGELAKLAARVEADAIVVADARQTTLAAAGQFASAFPPHEPMPVESDQSSGDAIDGVAHVGAETFRLVGAPLLLSNGTEIGTLYLATSLDRQYAQQLGDIARTNIAIVSDGTLVATTLQADTQRQFSAVAARLTDEGTVDLGGSSHAFRRLFRIADTSFYALTSIDDSARAAVGQTTRALMFIAIGALGLALLGSIWIAHRLSKPIGRLSASLHTMATSRQFDKRLEPTGFSVELDGLTATFNALMASVAAAEAETEAAYTAAIRALAAALDARDPYTAGHSERVSVVSVAIGRVLNLGADDLEVLRLGALLHDIGKIGVPDAVLMKPGPLTDSEYDTIKQHTVLGGRILRTVPFLSRHVAIVELHHERPDGRGYPHGLQGTEIPLAAHIVHVADAFDAMINARAYRPGRPPADAIRELWLCAGTDFHAEVVGALASALPSLTSTLPDPILEAACA